MSYGIICRVGGCKSYAEWRVETPLRKMFVCDRHKTTAAVSMSGDVRIVPVTQSDHEGPEGGKSISEQKS